MSGRPKVWLVSSPKFDEFPQKTLRRENLVDSDNMLDAVCGNDALLPFVIRIRESVLSAANETIENRAGDSTKDNQAYEDKKQSSRPTLPRNLFSSYLPIKSPIVFRTCLPRARNPSHSCYSPW
mmetsp:Transcript_40674/g.60287  ORF Transcript_40674/g.60287 Transcript_40674/m.60287 type:complete len:124 (-) Transcript_40674:23-394(-)